MSPTDDSDDTLHCEACGAVNPSYRARCSECKAPLPDPEDVPSAPPVRKAQQRRVHKERRARTGGALKKAQKAIRGVRGVYWLFAGLMALGGLGTVLTVDIGPSSEGEALRGYLTLAGAACAAAGALLLARFPLPCTVGLAVVAAGLAYVNLEPGIVSAPDLLRVGIALGLLAAIPVIQRALRLMDQEGIERERLWNQASRSEGKSIRNTALVAAGVSVLAVAGSVVYFAVITRPGPTIEETLAKEPPIEAAISDWTEAMEATDYDRARDMGTDYLGTKWPKVMAILEREGWAEEGLTLVNFTFKNEREGRKEVHFDLPRGLMKTLWLLEEGRWQPQSISFKGVRAR